MKSLNQRLKDYVDADQITPWNLSKAFIKERVWDMAKATTFIAFLSLAGGLIGKNIYANYNDALNSYQNAISGTLYNAVQDAEKGKISKKDLAKLQSKIESNQKNYGKQIVNGFLNFNYKQIIDGFKGVYETSKNPSIITSNAESLNKEYAGIIDGNEQKRSNLEKALDNVGKTGCNKDSIASYDITLKEFKETNLPFSEYEKKFKEIKTECIENRYFQTLKEDISDIITKRQKEGASKNDIALEIGMYFNDQQKDTILLNVKNLDARTKKLSIDVTKQLDGYKVDLTSYLPKNK